MSCTPAGSARSHGSYRPLTVLTLWLNRWLDAAGGARAADWRDIPRLKLLNLMYDATPMKYLTMVVTEVGVIPPTSVPAVIRETSAREGQS